MSETPSEAPRSWAPVAAAGAVALIVIVGAVIWWIAGAGVSDEQKAGIEACERLAIDEDLPAISRGDVEGPDADGVVSVSWEFEDATYGGCEVAVVDGTAGEPALVGDVAPSPSPSASPSA
ncbi:hypothetical protein [Demequina sp. NBRC 110057]|uniref:hypothetical protein n=1 Tax=Demequina sp. NBRC 110057 TaxID=1570346 RepID=UPI000A04DEEA|nr:hypothetical protein [Demequina sp. NBRC 110057]